MSKTSESQGVKELLHEALETLQQPYKDGIYKMRRLLDGEHCFGIRRSKSRNPISTYLRHKLEAKQACVVDGVAIVLMTDGRTASEALTPMAAAFLAAFDYNAFPGMVVTAAEWPAEVGEWFGWINPDGTVDVQD